MVREVSMVREVGRQGVEGGQGGEVGQGVEDGQGGEVGQEMRSHFEGVEFQCHYWHSFGMFNGWLMSDYHLAYIQCTNSTVDSTINSPTFTNKEAYLQNLESNKTPRNGTVSCFLHHQSYIQQITCSIRSFSFTCSPNFSLPPRSLITNGSKQECSIFCCSLLLKLGVFFVMQHARILSLISITCAEKLACIMMFLAPLFSFSGQLSLAILSISPLFVGFLYFRVLLAMRPGLCLGHLCTPLSQNLFSVSSFYAC